MYDLIIIGGGPAAVAAGIYAARKKLKTLLITESFGGQSMVSDNIENWIGEKMITGFDLAKKLEEHIRAQEGIEFRTPERVVRVNEIPCADGSPLPGFGGASKRPCDFLVETDQGGQYQAKAVIVTSGSRRRKLGVAGEDKFEGKGVAYCATCLPYREDVVANSSLMQISKVEENHPVLTADGSFKEVSQIMSRPYDGELIEVKTRFFSEPVQLTPNHPVLAATVEYGKPEHYWRDFKINEPIWMRADELTPKHWLLYPLIREVHNVERIHLSEILGVTVVDGMARNRHERHTSRRIPNEIPVDGDFLRLVGYYLAEGTHTPLGLNFYFSVHENLYIRDVVAIFESKFQLKPSLKVEGSVMRIQIYSKLVSRLFQALFREHAHNKRLPHWMSLLPPAKQAEIIKGFYRGDGCKREKDFCLVTNSRILVYQFRDILLRLGVIPAIQRRNVDKLNERPGSIGGRIIKFNHDKYHLLIGGPSLKRMSEILGVPHEKIGTRNRLCHHAWLKDHHLYLPIRSIKRRRYQGRVYNLVVKENQTYVAKNFIVHNCDAPIFAGKRVAVVGGGNAGLEAVVDLFPYASEIYLIHRGEQLKGDAVTQEEIRKNPKVKIILNAETREILGDKFVTGLQYKDAKTGEIKKLDIDGVFVEIGAVPNSEIVKGLVELNQFGEIVIDHKTGATSKPGIFAAGDVTDELYKQNNISAGDGITAALSAYAYITGLRKQSAAAEKPNG